jgi:hypothetical protein
MHNYKYICKRIREILKPLSVVNYYVSCWHPSTQKRLIQDPIELSLACKDIIDYYLGINLFITDKFIINFASILMKAMLKERKYLQ